MDNDSFFDTLLSLIVRKSWSKNLLYTVTERLEGANTLSSAVAQGLACGQFTINDICYYTPSLRCKSPRTADDVAGAESPVSPELASEITLAIHQPGEAVVGQGS